MELCSSLTRAAGADGNADLQIIAVADSLRPAQATRIRALPDYVEIGKRSNSLYFVAFSCGKSVPATGTRVFPSSSLIIASRKHPTCAVKPEGRLFPGNALANSHRDDDQIVT